MARQVTLSVNDQPIQLDSFVQAFIESTISGMLASLKGIGEIRSVGLSIDEDKLTININDALLPIKPFVIGIVRNTVMGMVSTLKGVNKINKLNITMKE